MDGGYPPNTKKKDDEIHTGESRRRRRMGMVPTTTARAKRQRGERVSSICMAVYVFPFFLLLSF
jgi:hypothetical protein